MNQNLARRAITCALRCNWEEALSLNKEILENNPLDVDAMNRLAKAYFELGKIDEAHKLTEKVLEIDPLNQIAEKCLAKYKLLAGSNVDWTNDGSSVVHQDFLEKPGKTRIISLIHLGETAIVCALGSGEAVKLFPTRHRVSICTHQGKYIGRLPDDLARQVISETRNGVKFEAYVKTAMSGNVKVLLKIC